jgi:hypothetical protein
LTVAAADGTFAARIDQGEGTVTRTVRTTAVGPLAAAGLAVFPGSAVAAPASTSFDVIGVETAFISTSASFAADEGVQMCTRESMR